MNTQLTLFKEQKPRRRNGRFCTKEQLRVERVDSENKRLWLEREKYYRAWLAASSKASRLERELCEIKNKIKNIV